MRSAPRYLQKVRVLLSAPFSTSFLSSQLQSSVLCLGRMSRMIEIVGRQNKTRYMLGKLMVAVKKIQSTIKVHHCMINKVIYLLQNQDIISHYIISAPQMARPECKWVSVVQPRKEMVGSFTQHKNLPMFDIALRDACLTFQCSMKQPV